jgi:hypothetical protein
VHDSSNNYSTSDGIYYNPDLHVGAKYIKFSDSSKRRSPNSKSDVSDPSVELLPLPPVPVVDSFTSPFYADARHDSDFFCVFSDSAVSATELFEAVEKKTDYSKDYSLTEVINSFPDPYSVTINITLKVSVLENGYSFKKIEKYSNFPSDKITFGFIDLAAGYSGIIIKQDDSAMLLWFNKMLDIYKTKEFFLSQIGRSDCSQRYLFPARNIYSWVGTKVNWNDRYITAVVATSGTMFLYDGYLSPEEIEAIDNRVLSGDFTFPELRNRVNAGELFVIYNYTLPGYYSGSYRCGWEYNLFYINKKTDVPCFVVFVPATTTSGNVNFDYWQGEIIPAGTIDVSHFACDGQIENNIVSPEIEARLISGISD